MIKKHIVLISLIFFLTHCGFSPIYVKNTNTNFSIEDVDYQGDRDLNNFLKIDLNQYKNDNSDRKILIEATSEYEKTILTKNTASEVTNYKLIANVTFLIKSTNKKILITISPVIPHFSNECMKMLNINEKMLWPKINEKFLFEENIKFIIQINGKTKKIIISKKDTSEDLLLKKIKNDEKIYDIYIFNIFFNSLWFFYNIYKKHKY